MNELNPKNAFGELLLDLIEAQYDGDYDSGVQALMQTTGLAPEEVEAIINGDTIVDDESLLTAIVDAFPDADGDDLEVIVNVATSVDEEDRAALVSQIEAEEAGAGAQAEEMEAAYGYGGYNTANFSSQPQYFNYADPRVSALEAKVANFEMAQFENALKNRLTQVDFQASQAVVEDRLPRSYKTMLVGDFSDPDARLARFGQIAAENGVDIPTMLFATEFALGLMTDAASFVEFKDYSLSDEDVAIANFSASLDAVAQNDVKAIFADSYLDMI